MARPASLRHPVVRRVQYPRREFVPMQRAVLGPVHQHPELVGLEELWHIFQHEHRRSGEANHPGILAPQQIAGIVGVACAEIRKTLTWRAAHDRIRPGKHLVGDQGNVVTDHMVAEVLRVGSRRRAVPLHRQNRIESGLAKALGETTTPGEQINKPHRLHLVYTESHFCHSR